MMSTPRKTPRKTPSKRPSMTPSGLPPRKQMLTTPRRTPAKMENDQGEEGIQGMTVRKKIEFAVDSYVCDRSVCDIVYKGCLPSFILTLTSLAFLLKQSPFVCDLSIPMRVLVNVSGKFYPSTLPLHRRLWMDNHCPNVSRVEHSSPLTRPLEETLPHSKSTIR